MPQPNRAQIHSLIIEALRPFGVQKISLFGSFARKETNARDIDILVELKSHKKRPPVGMAWFSLNEELAKKIGMPVDIVSENSVPHSLRSIIEKDLEVIYEEAG